MDLFDGDLFADFPENLRPTDRAFVFGGAVFCNKYIAKHEFNI